MKKEITMLELSNTVTGLSNTITGLADAMNARFDRVETKLENLQATTRQGLGVVTDLVHGVSKVAQRTEEELKKLIPTTTDHEERISALERSNIRLRLLIDR
jgi:hypothetical protein